MSDLRGCHAVVIGGSMAGLLAARVLSIYFEQVTILERDPVSRNPESRRGQPHTRHLHALLAQGWSVLERYFPTLRDDVCAGGGELGDMGADIRWHACGGYRRQFQSGLVGVMASRPFLEYCIRTHVVGLPNVHIRDSCTAHAPVTTRDRQRVTGVEVMTTDRPSHEVIDADLVIDASGRGSATPRWLVAMGYRRPRETAVRVDMGYATRVFRRRPNDLEGARLLMISPELPALGRAGYIVPIEGERWIATLGGWGGDHPPTDAAGFLAFARSLAAPDVYELMRRLDPLSDVVSHRLPSNRRWHYERVRMPTGYLVIGDALGSFNPVYAQGMTAAAMQAAVLDDVLRGARDGLDRVGRRYLPRAAKVVDTAWRIAVGEDFRARETAGRRPLGTCAINGYMACVHRATHSDTVVYRALLEVMNLIVPPARLMGPDLLWRVARNTISHGPSMTLSKSRA